MYMPKIHAHTFRYKHEKCIQINIVLTIIIVLTITFFINYNSKNAKAIVYSFQKKYLKISDFIFLICSLGGMAEGFINFLENILSPKGA